MWEALFPNTGAHRTGALLDGAPSEPTPIWRGLRQSSTAARTSSETSTPDGISLENPIFCVDHAFGVLPADGRVRIITAGLYCIRVYNSRGTPIRRADQPLLRYLPSWNDAFEVALDKLAKQCPEIVTHFACFRRGADVGLLYFASLADAENWLKHTSHTLEPLGFRVFADSAKHFFSSETSFMLYPIPAVSMALGLRLEPAKVISSTFPPSSPIFPKGWAECELSISCRICESWPAPSERCLLH